MDHLITKKLERVKAEKLVEALYKYSDTINARFEFKLENAVDPKFYYVKVYTLQSIAFEFFWVEKFEAFCSGFLSVE